MHLKKYLFFFVIVVGLFSIHGCEEEHIVVIDKGDDVLIVDTVYRSTSFLLFVDDTLYKWKSSRTSEAVDDASLIELYTQDNRFSSTGRSEKLSVFAWSNNQDGEPSYDSRVLIRFNELDLLGDVEIDSAFMTLHVNHLVPFIPFNGPYGTNRIRVYLASDSWEENTVNWENQPDYDEINYVETKDIKLSDDSLVVSVTDHISKILVKGNKGFLLKNWNEDMPLSSVKFYSSDAEQESKRPYLNVYYHEK